MLLSIFLLSCLLNIPLPSLSLPAPTGYLLNCGSPNETTQGNLKYIPDEGFIYVGNKSAIKTPNLLPILSTVRYFPDTTAKKYCYELPVMKGKKYLVRTTYFYGDYDGGKVPPVFDQLVQGTKWSIVNTTEDYLNNLSSYYEIIVLSMSKTLSVCLARNEITRSSPFISALEIEYLEDSVYNSTDFSKYALSTVARNSFGSESVIGFPDDQFNRLWQPFEDQNPTVQSQSKITSSQFWNFPPQIAFTTGQTTSRGKTLNIQWPVVSLPNTMYYIALYFQDNRTPSPYSWRSFNVAINGQTFYKDLNVTTDGVTVSAPKWPLLGQTEITLTPGDNVPVGPVINAAEMFQILPLGGRTLTRDVMVMEELARSFDNPPSDWNGDPCLPTEYSWTGVKCSKHYMSRVISLNLTSMGISGSLPASIANLTALSHMWLGNNKLSGTIPDMSTMKELKTLHLEDNFFEGSIPQSLGYLPKLYDIYLQENNLSGKIPSSLRNRNGMNIQVSPGNHLSS